MVVNYQKSRSQRHPCETRWLKTVLLNVLSMNLLRLGSGRVGVTIVGISNYSRYKQEFVGCRDYLWDKWSSVWVCMGFSVSYLKLTLSPTYLFMILNSFRLETTCLRHYYLHLNYPWLYISPTFRVGDISASVNSKKGNSNSNILSQQNNSYNPVNFLLIRITNQLQ